MIKKCIPLKLRDFSCEYDNNKIYEIEIFLNNSQNTYMERLVFRGVSNYEIDDNFLIIFNETNKIKYINIQSIQYFNVEVFCDEE